MPDVADNEVERASAAFLTRWTRLVSTTNWEKGRIIHEWRAALRGEGAAAGDYSDEAWSRRVGSVSSQHVGRLRRVWERFADQRDQYAGLYWSHFQAALDWHDAEMWLEGAVQSEWSISQMCRQRWLATGGVAEEEPPAADPPEGDYDEDASADADAADNVDVGGLPDFAHREAEDDSPPEAEPDSDAPVPFDDFADDVSATAAAAPFARLAELPDDVQEAVESLKLVILRHKLAGWAEISRDDLLAALDALSGLALDASG